MRFSFSLAENMYVTSTFVVDTGCCSHFLLCDTLWNILLCNGRLLKDVFYIKIKVGEISTKCLVYNEMPENHKPVNIIGLPMFFLLNLKFRHNKIQSFTFDEQNCAYDCVDFVNFDFL